MRHLLRSFVALLLLVAVACSGSESKEAADKKPTTTTTTTIKTLQANEVDAKASPYCRTWADIREIGGPPLTGDPNKDTEARKSHYARLVPLTEKLVSEAESAIKSQAQFALDQVKEVAATGSDAPFSKPGAAKVQQELAKYALDHCAKQ